AVSAPSASTAGATARRWAQSPRAVPRAQGVVQSTSVVSGMRMAWIVSGSISRSGDFISAAPMPHDRAAIVASARPRRRASGSAAAAAGAACCSLTMRASPPRVTAQPSAAASVRRSPNHQIASAPATSGYPAVEIVTARARPSVFALSRYAVSPTPRATRTLTTIETHAPAVRPWSPLGSPATRAAGIRNRLPTAERTMLRERLGTRVASVRASSVMSVHASALESAARIPNTGPGPDATRPDCSTGAEGACVAGRTRARRGLARGSSGRPGGVGPPRRALSGLPGLVPRGPDQLREAVGRDRAPRRQQEVPGAGLGHRRPHLRPDPRGRDVGEVRVAEPADQRQRRPAPHLGERRARLPVGPRDRVHGVIQQAIEVDGVPVGVEDVELAVGPDRLQQRQVLRPHEALVLLEGEGLRRGRDREEDARRPVLEARDRVPDQVV